MGVRERSPRDPSERSVTDRFESFNLSIERIGETYRAEVTSSPVGPRPPVSIDPSQLDAGESSAGETLETPRDVRRRPVDRNDLRRLGERLFRAAFQGAVAEAFRASVERARGQGAGLRIRLLLDRAPELATLPWEALWDPTSRAFLADQPDLPVVRALSVSAAAPEPRPAESPLRLLALLPEPRGESKLDGAEEWRQIGEHLAPAIEAGFVSVDRLEPPTLEALGRRIGRGPCHVLHVVAHGSPGDPGTGGVLKLENASGGSDAVTGGDLARALEHQTPPRLVMLSACHGARAAIDDAFDGLAQHLLSRGVPAVIAMRTAISDSAAVSFAGELYRQLASGRTVEAAMVEARRALSLGQHRTEWATPALYLRGQDVRILEPPTGEGAAPAGVVSRRRWRKGPLAVGTALVAAIAALATWMNRDTANSTGEIESCPSPPGLHDLEFVRITPNVVDLGDRKLILEDAFCIGTKEVSRRDWRKLMGGELPRSEWPLDWPMTDVTPDDVEAFLRKLDAMDAEVTYRLPTDVEWEFAARAGQATDYFFGDDASKLHEYGNCRNILDPDGYDGPAPIGSYRSNAWGIYDVHGNVAEWVQWPEDDGSSIDEGQQRALRRGGSFENAPRGCSFPGSRSPVMASKPNRQDTGFRVVRELARPGNRQTPSTRE